MRGCAGLLLLSLVSLSGSQATWRSVELRANNGDVDAHSCAWEPGAAGVFHIDADNRLGVNCDAASSTAIVRCDPTGVEPRDASAPALCASPSMTFDAAAPVALSTAAPVDTRVVWMRVAGEALIVRAMRTFKAGSSISILVADDSLIRIAPAGLSPRTLLGSTLATQSTALRGAPSSGEIFARQQRATVDPIAIEVAASGRRTGPTYRLPWFSAPDLPPGLYTLTRLYAGGVRTTGTPVSVRPVSTTEVLLPFERVGGVRLTADQFVCVPESRFELLPVAGLSDKPVVTTAATPCAWTIGGLAPGLYHARITPDPVTGTPADVDITVSNQEWVQAQLLTPPVVVRGRILVMGRALARKEIRFVAAKAASAVATTVTTDDEGQFVVGLPAPGPFDIAFETQMFGTRTYHPDFGPGENRLDLDVVGAMLRVTITQAGEKPKGPITLRIRGPRDTIDQVITQFDRTVDIDGLPFGSYVLSAKNTDGLQSLDQGVTLSEKQSVALVWLDVSRERRVLRVQTESGQPIRQATIMVNKGGMQSVDAPSGVFPIPPLPVRTPIYVASPGYSPSCVIVTGANEEQATMFAHIAAVELRFPHQAGGTAVISGDLFGIPWASCGVPLDKTDAQIVPHPEYDSVMLHLPIGQIQIERNGTRQIFDVPGFPVIVR